MSDSRQQSPYNRYRVRAWPTSNMLLVSTTRIIPRRAAPSLPSGRYSAVKVRKILYVTVLQLGGRQRPDEPGVGVRVLPGGIVPSARTPTRRDCRQTKIRVGARAHSLFGAHKDSAALRAALSITYLGDC